MAYASITHAERRRSVAWAGSALAALALLVMAGCGDKHRQGSVHEQFEQAQQGKISGEQALTLAKRLRVDAFNQPAVTGAPAAEAPVVASATASARERDAIAHAPHVSRREMLAVARQSFQDAAATLLQDPDTRVRIAVIQLRAGDTQSGGVDALWALAREGTGQSSAIWRVCGALMVATGDDRATTALENVRALNPQDKGLWRLLSFAYARQTRPREAAGAALIGAGIDAAAASNWREARTDLNEALPLIADGPTRGFVLGQLGDAAAATEDWDGAEKNYRAALEIHGAEKNAAALSLDSSKLARAQIKRGDSPRACETLRKARVQSALVTESELRQACAAK